MHVSTRCVCYGPEGDETVVLPLSEDALARVRSAARRDYQPS